MSALVPRERIEQTIRIFRSHRVMLDTDLAELYGVSTKVLNQAVKRNAARFPNDFMFQLTGDEVAALRSQIVTLNRAEKLRWSQFATTSSKHGNGKG